MFSNQIGYSRLLWVGIAVCALCLISAARSMVHGAYSAASIELFFLILAGVLTANIYRKTLRK